MGDGKVTIRQEGKVKKFIAQVEQITFNGRGAAVRQQNLTFITERAVFKLRAEGLELVEIAPGVDLQRDLLDHMDFAPIVRNVKTMDPALFQPATDLWVRSICSRSARGARCCMCG